jgi:hypothetical protein
MPYTKHPSGLISLNEAVTILMDERRNARQEIGRLMAVQGPLRTLALTCHRELKRSAAGRDLLYAMAPDAIDRPSPLVPPYWPPQMVLERLGDRREDWPAALIALYDTAAAIGAQLEQYDQRYAQALHALIEAGRLGRVRFSGCLERTPNSESVPIPDRYFLSNVAIDGDRTRLIPNAGPRGSLPGYQSACQATGRLQIYHDVQVEAAEIEQLIAGHPSTGPDTRVLTALSPRLPRLTGVERIAWHNKFQSDFCASYGRPPDESETIDALKCVDSSKSPRELVRVLRKGGRPRGRPPGKSATK